MKRRISWVFGVLAYVAPPTWAYFEQVSVYGNLNEQYGYVCGLPMLAIVMFAAMSAALLSGVAVWFSYLSFRALPRPRPVYRVVELAVLSGPLVFSVAIVALLFSV